MKKLTLILLLFSTIGVCQNTLEDKKSEISKYVQSVKDDYNLPGIVVAITNGNEIEYIESFGNVSKDDNFIIGSNSKAFTALIILKLQERGLLNINDPVVKYLDWFEYQNKSVSDKITLKDLLHHTSGLSLEMGREFPKKDAENVKTNIAKKLKSVKLDTYPISEFVYSNTNYQLIGYVIEKVTNRDFSSVLKTEITLPLQMNHTSTDLSEDVAQGYQYLLYYPIIPVNVNYNKVNIPAGYINSNANDLAKYSRELMNSYNDTSGTLIKKSLTDELFKPNDKNNSKYALGWYSIGSDDTEIFFHNGAIHGFKSAIAIVPKMEKSIIVLINSFEGSPSEMSRSIFQILTNKSPGESSKLSFYLIRSLPILVLVIFLVLLFFTRKWIKRQYPMKMTKRLLPNLILIFGIIFGLGWVLYLPSIFEASLANILDFDVSSGYSIILLCIFIIALSIVVYFNHNDKTLPNNV